MKMRVAIFLPVVMTFGVVSVFSATARSGFQSLQEYVCFVYDCPM